MKKNMIEIEKLGKSYDNLAVLKDISLTIADGEIYGLVGRSGAGKSTLLRCMNRLEVFQSGTMTVDGVDVSKLEGAKLREFRKNVGMIFQHFSILERKTVYDNVAYPLKCWKVPKKESDAKIKELVKLVGLEEKLHVKAKNLSGGQKQRVAIARALALNPTILLCDEATSALDPRTTQDILALLRQINEELGITIVVVTHQMSVVRQICNKVALLENGVIVENGDVGEVFMRQSGALKRLIGEEDIEYPDGFNVEIITEEGESSETVFYNITKEVDVPYSVVSGEVEHFRSKTFGRFVLHFEETNRQKVIDYLERKNIVYKECKDNK